MHPTSDPRPVAVDAVDEDALGRVRDRMAASYPSASPEHIVGVLRAHLELTRDAQVQGFRLVLAERATRTQLRLEGHVGEGGWRRQTSPPAGSISPRGGRGRVGRRGRRS